MLQKAYQYLDSAWSENGEFKTNCFAPSTFEKIPIPSEIFSSLIILELLGDLQLNSTIKNHLIKKIQLSCNEEGQCCFFPDQPEIIPADVDDTALAIATLTHYKAVDPCLARKGIESILANINPNGVIQTFFSNKRRSVLDPVVCANALRLLYQYKQEKKAKKTEEFIYDSLHDQNFGGGSIYYPPPDVFLWAVSRLLALSSQLREKFSPILKIRLLERIDSTENPLDLSMRIITAQCLDVPNQSEIEKLIKLQTSDGYWEENLFYTGYLPSRIEWLYFGSREVSTAFAIKALHQA